MAALTVTVNQAQLDDVYKTLDGFIGTITSDKGASAAIRRATNKTVTHAQSRIVKRVADEVNLIQKNIRPMTKPVNANFTDQTGKVIISGKAIPLIAFPTKTATGISGIFVAVRRGRPEEFFRHRFIARVQNKYSGQNLDFVDRHLGIFERGLNADGTQVGRLQIDEQFGPSVGMVFYHNSTEDMTEIADFFARTLDHEVEFILLRHNNGKRKKVT